MKEDEERKRFWYLFKKTVLRIRDGKENPVYLIRYSIFTCPWFAIKLHRIMLSDDDCMHDHPWSFISIILSGGYFEHSFVNRSRSVLSLGTISPTWKRWYGIGSILWRPSPSIHKLELPEGKTATTIVITFKKKRQWGFYTPSGWKVWFEYIRSGQKCE
jgi:hypothetical protein